MSYTNVYPSRINWENEPSINTPINEVNLNKMDYALYSHDQTLAQWDTSKANQSDLLLSVKSIDYDTSTGVFVFTWQNGTTKTVDLNIEKIPVSFSMDANGVITMTTDDGTTYTADVGALIKTYTFNDSAVIDFTVTTDASGNKTITADIVDGSITGQKLQPNYLADCQTAETNAGNSATAAAGSKGDAEAWAVGTRGGVPVPSTDPAFNNNSYYWSQHGASSSLAGLTDTDINNPQNNQTLKYDATSQKWINVTGGGGAGSLDDLSDVALTAPQAEGDVLVRDANGIYVNNPKSLYPSAPTMTWAEYQQLVDNEEDDPDAEYYIDDIDVAEAYYVETSGQTALTGATSLTFTNSHIKPTADIRILAEPNSCKVSTNPQYKVSAKLSSVGNGTATITFPALAENTEFWLLIECPLAVTVDPAYVYNTDETVIGQWIDGKTIYRKTIDVGAMPNATSKNVAHNISNISNVISMYGYATGGTDWIPLPRVDNQYSIGLYVTATNIVIHDNSNQSSRSGYVTLEYTKTTD